LCRPDLGGERLPNVYQATSMLGGLIAAMSGCASGLKTRWSGHSSRKEIRMARVKIEEIIYHLDRDMKRALEIAVNEEIPNAQFDRNRLFKAFLRGVRRKCGTWENVPSHYVDD